MLQQGSVMASFGVLSAMQRPSQPEHGKCGEFQRPWQLKRPTSIDSEDSRETSLGSTQENSSPKRQESGRTSWGTTSNLSPSGSSSSQHLLERREQQQQLLDWGDGKTPCWVEATRDDLSVSTTSDAKDFDYVEVAGLSYSFCPSAQDEDAINEDGPLVADVNSSLLSPHKQILWL